MTPIDAGPRFRGGQAVLVRTYEGWERAWVVRTFRPTADGVWRYLIGYQYKAPRNGKLVECVMGVDETEIQAVAGAAG